MPELNPTLDTLTNDQLLNTREHTVALLELSEHIVTLDATDDGGRR
jgi:hypothetical protein